MKIKRIIIDCFKSGYLIEISDSHKLDEGEREKMARTTKAEMIKTITGWDI